MSDNLLHFDSQVVPKAFEQDTQSPTSSQTNGTAHYIDPIRQAFLTRDVHNVRSAKEAVFDHRKIEHITQRLIEQLVRQFVLNFQFILCFTIRELHKKLIIKICQSIEPDIFWF